MFTNSSVTLTTTEVYDEDSRQKLVQQVNDVKTQQLTPVLVYLIILMSLGIVGNSFVLYVYKFRFKQSSSRAFILCLAILDFITCIFGIPYHLYDIYHTVTYYNAIGCKVLSFSMSITLLSSVFILALISVDRYQKICRPFARQLSDFGTKKACVAGVVIATVIAVPHLIMYGNATVTIEAGRNVTGIECFINDEYAGSTESIIYLGTLFLIFNVTTIVLCVLYMLIGCKIWTPGSSHAADDKGKGTCRKGSFRLCGGSDTHTQEEILSETDDSHKSSVKIKSIAFHKDDRNGNACSMEFERSCDSPIVKKSARVGTPHTPKSALPNISRNSKKRKQRLSFFEKQRKHTMSVSDDEGTSFTGESKPKLGKTVSVLSGTSLSRRQRRTLRITGMLFLVTLVFVISFLPHLIILIIETVNPEMFEDMSPSGELIYNFLLRTYFINTMANPIVYAFLDPKFRSEVFNIFICIFKCKCRNGPRV